MLRTNTEAFQARGSALLVDVGRNPSAARRGPNRRHWGDTREESDMGFRLKWVFPPTSGDTTLQINQGR